MLIKIICLWCIIQWEVFANANVASAFGLCLNLYSRINSRISYVMRWLETLKSCIAFACVNTEYCFDSTSFITYLQRQGNWCASFVVRVASTSQHSTTYYTTIGSHNKNEIKNVYCSPNEINEMKMHASPSQVYNWRHLEWQVQKKFMSSKQMTENNFSKCNKFSYSIIQMGLVIQSVQRWNLRASYTENLIVWTSKIFGASNYVDCIICATFVIFYRLLHSQHIFFLLTFHRSHFARSIHLIKSTDSFNLMGFRGKAINKN